MDYSLDIKELIDKKADEVDAIIREHLMDETGYAATVYKAMNYSITAGGKRLRPMLMRELYNLFGGGDYKVLSYFMTAIEMIHSYSLVHDDLPALDNDDLRRGKPSTHKQFGEAMGILAGDGLLNSAYEQISQALTAIVSGEVVGAVERREQLRRAVIAFDKISSCAGVSGMIGGQVVDVENTGKDMDADMLLYVYRGKTSALIAASMMVGAALGGADDYSLQMVERIGCDVGMAFQIRDDILDVTGDEDKIGKPIHSDDKLLKSTYVAINGIDESEIAVKEYTNQAIEKLEALPIASLGVQTKIFLKELFLYMASRDH